MISPEKMNASVKKILIVFDAAGFSPVSMHTVIELAARSQTSVQALYIEDSNLLNAVELPFTREVLLHTAEKSSINAELILEKLRADAENVKKQIEKIAVTSSVSLSFSSTRGQKTQIIRNCTDEVNMVLIPAVYSTTELKQHHRLKHTVAIIYDEQNPSSEKALNIALSQATKNNYQLFVLTDNQQSKQHVERLISEQNLHAVCQIADFTSIEDILLLLQAYSPGLLVLSENSQLTDKEKALKHLINSLESDILLVR